MLATGTCRTFLRQPEEAITAQQLVDLYRTAHRTPADS